MDQLPRAARLEVRSTGRNGPWRFPRIVSLHDGARVGEERAPRQGELLGKGEVDPSSPPCPQGLCFS